MSLAPSGQYNRRTNRMTNAHLENEFDEALQRYLDLGESAAIIVREMKKTPNSEVRRKLTHELRNADKKRIEILNQIDGLLA